MGLYMSGHISQIAFTKIFIFGGVVAEGDEARKIVPTNNTAQLIIEPVYSITSAMRP